MDITTGLKFKLDGNGDLYEVTEIVSQKLLDIRTPKVAHVTITSGYNKGKKAQGSPILIGEANDMIKKGYWVIQ